MTPPSGEQIRALPKVELHVHLEGTFRPERVAELATLVGEAPPRPVDQLFDVDNLADFLDTLDWVCGLVRDEPTAEQVAHDFAAYAHDQGILYAEVIVNPTHWSGLSTEELFSACAQGFDRAEADGLGDFRLLPSVLRQQTEQEARQLVAWIEGAALDRIVGLSIDGNEAAAGRTGPRFASAYAEAGRIGLGRTAHAGESSGAEGVRDAIELLGVSRIDHGVRCGEDPTALALVLEHDITLNVCLTSNCTLLYPNLDSHPIRDLADAGVRFTINTDDPETLGITLCGELQLAADHLGWDLGDLIAAQHRAIDAAFCSEVDKDALRRRLDQTVGT
ncbi:adenosine deaminase [Candidatus Poriferisocius sp.]|uniref:adenosine deaminase n=1 Tax=Candidatus Poriferisocius sp. TaxID=3101276 RepID=UPI003B5ABE2C